MGGREELRYKELVESLNDAVYTVNIKTLIFTSANHAAEKLTGYSKEEMLQMNVGKVIAPEFHQLVKKMIARKRKKEQQSTIYEIEVINKQGKRIPVEISSVAIHEKGVPVEILGVARDITERKIMEMQRNVFVSIMTHEIKNPLTSVVVYLDLLQKHLKSDTKALTYVSSIGQQMSAMNQLMSDFLDATQMRVGKFQLTKEAFDLNEVIDDAVKSFRLEKRVKRQGMATKMVTADRNRIRQVLVNLLSNAVKYSPEDKDIIISVEETAGKVIVGVKDFGHGIAKANQKHIFDLFYRIQDDARGKVKGHGLGLFICNEIIKRHKGKIRVESAPEKGATFLFTLPEVS